ncbi:HNH endonuclease [Rathayibacter sp. AY1A7]|uniref:HNH endonuclease n=1 Tax=Rathayibacter sp. AY1A7 TaxID=2080524 RepID=UPI001C66D083|nr:HNH endonuclease [Rathayibacter sp. AY1A7]
MKGRRGRASSATTALVLRHYGVICHLCGRANATTKDHLIPWSLGGRDELSNLRPACDPCNKRRGNRVLNGYGCSITVVMGPPAGGKSTYVHEHAGPRDVVVDLDAILRAFVLPGTDPGHDTPGWLRYPAIVARRAAIDRLSRQLYPPDVRVWIIHSMPDAKRLEEYRFLRYHLVTVDPGREVVTARALEERGGYALDGILRWYRDYAQQPALDAAPARPELTAGAPDPYW